MYRHYQEAAKVLGKVLRPERTEVRQGPLSFYRCEFCSHFHLTSYAPERTAGITRCVRRRQKKKKEQQP